MCIKKLKERLTAIKNNRLSSNYRKSKRKGFMKDNKNWIGKSCDVVFLGDSLTDYCELDKYYSGYTKVNRGIGSDSTTGVLKRLDISVYPFNPKIVILLIGVNNIKTMENDYEDIIKNILEYNNKIKFVLVSLLPTTGEFSYLNEDSPQRNVYIKGIAEKYGFPYVDVNTPLKDSDGKLKKEYTVDNIHLSHEGYLVMTPLIDKEVKKLLEE